MLTCVAVIDYLIDLPTLAWPMGIHNPLFIHTAQCHAPRVHGSGQSQPTLSFSSLSLAKSSDNYIKGCHRPLLYFFPSTLFLTTNPILAHPHPHPHPLISHHSHLLLSIYPTSPSFSRLLVLFFFLTKSGSKHIYPQQHHFQHVQV